MNQEEPGMRAPIQVRQAGGIWRVTKDGRFYGDFHAKQDALEAGEVAGRGAVLPASCRRQYARHPHFAFCDT
jgi:hypothetical protein